MLLALTLALVIGLVLGLLGGGGSVLTVPMLVYVLGVEPKSAMLTSFTVIGASSLWAIVQHARKHHVCWKSGAFFGLAGMVGAYGGGRLAMHFSDEALMALFGAVTLVTGIAMLLHRRPSHEHRLATGRGLCPTQPPYPRLLFDGFFVGALTGLIGVGGGFLIVPALTLLVGLPMPAAIGTSLLIVAMNALAGLSGYVQHARLDLPLTAVIMAGTVTGSLLGGWLSLRIGAAILRKLFGVFVVLVAAYVLQQSLTAQLLADLTERLALHREFLLGVASLAGILVLRRIAFWLHRAVPSNSHEGRLQENRGP